jgi:hypothetical protein
MEYESSKNIGLEVGDSREVKRHSPRLIERGMDNMSVKYTVMEVVSDASRGIISLLDKLDTHCVAIMGTYLDWESMYHMSTRTQGLFAHK